MKEYLHSLKRNLPIVFLVALAAAFLAFWLTGRQGVVHEVYFSYLVSLEQREDSADYRFDGFYALQATELFSETLARWINTPEVIAAAYEESGVVMRIENARQLTRVVRAEMEAPQLVGVSVRHRDRETAVLLAEGIQGVMSRNIENYHELGIPELSFRAVPTDLWVGHARISVPVVVGGVFVLVLLLGVNLVLLSASLRRIND